MRRREFIAALGSVAAWPIAAGAQQPGGMKRVAVLMGTEEDSDGQERLAAFRQGLQDLNWVESRNLRFDIRWGAGDAASLSSPRGNITGFASFNAEIAGKWLQLLKEISPGIERVVVIYNPETAPYAIFLPVMEGVAPQIAVKLIRAPITDKAGIESAISGLASAPGSGLMIMPDVFTTLQSRDDF